MAGEGFIPGREVCLASCSEAAEEERSNPIQYREARRVSSCRSSRNVDVVMIVQGG
jgi:hypothetical protein